MRMHTRIHHPPLFALSRPSMWRNVGREAYEIQARQELAASGDTPLGPCVPQRETCTPCRKTLHGVYLTMRVHSRQRTESSDPGSQSETDGSGSTFYGTSSDATRDSQAWDEFQSDVDDDEEYDDGDSGSSFDDNGVEDP